MINYFKRIKCEHSYNIKVEEYYGDNIIRNNFYRSLWKCNKCGSLSKSEYLEEYKPRK